MLVLPASESDPYAGVSPHAQTLEQRALALWRLRKQSQDFVLLTARALARKTVAPSAIIEAGTVLKRNLDIAPEDLVENSSRPVTCVKIRFQLSASFRFAAVL